MNRLWTRSLVHSYLPNRPSSHLCPEVFRKDRIRRRDGGPGVNKRIFPEKELRLKKIPEDRSRDVLPSKEK